MMSTSKIFAKRFPRMILLLVALCLLTSMIGCSPRFVAVDSTKPTTITQGELDRIYQDNEQLLKALEECRSGR